MLAPMTLEGPSPFERERAAREAAEAAEARSAFLAEASRQLGASLDTEAALRTIARLAVPAVADWCAVHVVAEDGAIVPLATAHADPAREALAAELLARHPLRPGARRGVPAVVRTGQTLFIPELPADLVARAVPDPADLARVEALRLRSLIVVPLAARGVTFGTITLVAAESGRTWGPTDVALAEDLARRAAVAVDNARLLAEARRRRREAEVVAEIARSINAALELDAILQRVAEGARELCASDLSAIALREADTGTMVFRYRAGVRYAEGARLVVEPGRGAGGLVLATGRPLRSARLLEDPRFRDDAAYLEAVRRERIVSLMVAPIRIDDRVEGLLYVDHRSPRAFSDRDEAVLLQLAEHAAIAIRNVQLLAREQRARGEAEAASRAKDEFLATVSHELRTPLQSMLGWASVLRSSRLPPDLTERALEAIERNTRLQAQLIEDLLDVSRIVSGKLRLDVRPADLHAIVAAAVEAVAPAAQARSLALELALDPAVGPISADPDRLQQVVWNLLSNAIKFTPRGGRVRLSLDADGDDVRLRVSDTGIGIRPEFLPYIFDRFRQAESHTARSHGGLGLGLAIVRHLVELQGGSVKAESPGEGGGAVFTVILPAPPASLRARLDGAPPRAARPRPVPLEGLRVLVVDDEADARDLVALVLQQAGAQVVAVDGALAALEALQRATPDVLVSDLGMPGVDGHALMARVRQDARAKRLPAVALTAYARDTDQRRARESGFDAHLAKPAEPDALVALVARLARQPRTG
jgi:signal transduction histidine kinase/CheY-like chemotaxis protein